MGPARCGVAPLLLAADWSEWPTKRFPKNQNARAKQSRVPCLGLTNLTWLCAISSLLWQRTGMRPGMFDQKCQSNSSRLWWKQKMRGPRPVQTLERAQVAFIKYHYSGSSQANGKVGISVFFGQRSLSPSLRREGVSDGSEHLSFPAPTPPSARKSHRIIVIGWENFNWYNGKLLSLNFCKHNQGMVISCFVLFGQTGFGLD